MGASTSRPSASPSFALAPLSPHATSLHHNVQGTKFDEAAHHGRQSTPAPSSTSVCHTVPIIKLPIRLRKQTFGMQTLEDGALQLSFMFDCERASRVSLFVDCSESKAKSLAITSPAAQQHHDAAIFSPRASHQYISPPFRPTSPTSTTTVIIRMEALTYSDDSGADLQRLQQLPVGGPLSSASVALTTVLTITAPTPTTPHHTATTTRQRLWTGSALYKLKKVYGCEPEEPLTPPTLPMDGPPTPVASPTATAAASQLVAPEDVSGLHSSSNTYRDDDDDDDGAQAGGSSCRSSLDGIATSGCDGSHGGYGEALGPRCPTAKLCVVCLHAGKDTLLLPCRHLCLCEACANMVAASSNRCPLCRAKVRRYLRVQA